MCFICLLKFRWKCLSFQQSLSELSWRHACRSSYEAFFTRQILTKIEMSRNSGRPTYISLHIRFHKKPFSGFHIVSCLQRVRRTELSYQAPARLPMRPKPLHPDGDSNPDLLSREIQCCHSTERRAFCAVGLLAVGDAKACILVLAYTNVIHRATSGHAVLCISRYAWTVIR